MTTNEQCPETSTDVLSIRDIDSGAVEQLLARFGLSVEYVADHHSITGSFWGDPEAGIVGRRVYARADTPLHSLLHEACHIICMNEQRRQRLYRDAGGDDLEESAVCYLQIVLADCLPRVGRDRLMQDMDAWGYSFRAGLTSRWFAADAADAREWLCAKQLLDVAGKPRFRLRE